MDQFNRSASYSTRWAPSKKIGRVRCIEFSRSNLPTHGNIQRERVVTDRIIKIDELSVLRIGKLLPRWLQWGLSNDCLLEIEIRKSEPTRRLSQNRLYWQVVDETHDQMPALMGEDHSKRNWDLFYREKFLGYESFEAMGKIGHTLHEHKHLGVSGFSDYLTQVIKFAGECKVQMRHDWWQQYDQVKGKQERAA